MRLDEVKMKKALKTWQDIAHSYDHYGIIAKESEQMAENIKEFIGELDSGK